VDARHALSGSRLNSSAVGLRLNEILTDMPAPPRDLPIFADDASLLSILDILLAGLLMTILEVVLSGIPCFARFFSPEIVARAFVWAAAFVPAARFLPPVLPPVPLTLEKAITGVFDGALSTSMVDGSGLCGSIGVLLLLLLLLVVVVVAARVAVLFPGSPSGIFPCCCHCFLMAAPFRDRSRITSPAAAAAWLMLRTRWPVAWLTGPLSGYLSRSSGSIFSSGRMTKDSPALKYINCSALSALTESVETSILLNSALRDCASFFSKSFSCLIC